MNNLNLSELFYKKAISNELENLRDFNGFVIDKLEKMEKNVIYSITDEFNNKRIYKIDFRNIYLKSPVMLSFKNNVMELFGKYFPDRWDNGWALAERLNVDPDFEDGKSFAFFLVHDLVHTVLEKDFIERLENQDLSQDNVSFGDLFHEELSSSLDTKRIKFIKYNIASRLLVNLKNNTWFGINSFAEQVKQCIDRTINDVLKQVSGFVGEKQQLVRWLLSKYKKAMISYVDSHPEFVVDKISDVSFHFLADTIIDNCESVDLEFKEKLRNSNILEQSLGSSLKDFLRDVIKEYARVVDYFSKFKVESKD